jgi:8-oxo-dGTP pyrophosphatase MutT (NUDIX family)/Txe/YoeB family toxin of Txe-Axe toxin-antitoxin module
MPQAVSKRQYRMMMAILHGKAKDGPRGRPPKSVAGKYTAPGGNAPEQSGQDRGGTWGEGHHKRDREKVKAARKERRKSKKHLKKAFEEFYKGRGRAAATIIMDNSNRILLGTHSKGGIAFTGGHLEPNESFGDAALRELHEEAGVIGRLSGEVWRGTLEGNEVVVYLGEIASGKPKSTRSDGGHESMSNWKWYEFDEIPWEKLRACCAEPLKAFIGKRFGKSLQGMMALEILEKNIIRQKSDAVFEVTHGDSLKLVGNGMFRMLREAVKDMKDEDFKDIHFDTYVVSIRKHMNDVYSGRVNDGHKMVYQFTNKSLPEMTAALMSVFEWYMPEDEKLFDILDENVLSDDAIHGGINELIENFRRHNIGNIYQEMETIREQMRNGAAVDLQQVEGRMMKLFDKLEDAVHELTGKHNKLVESAGKDLDELELKLRELQQKIHDVEKIPQKVEAFSAQPANKDKVHAEYYSYLSKPKVEIAPSGRITISFSSDWQDMEKENFLKDMRARVITKAGASHD